MKIYLKINDDGIIEDAKFQMFGCTAAIASSSIAIDMIIGKPVTEALKLDNKAIIKELGDLPAQKIHCSMLAKEAIEAAVEDYKKRKARATKRKFKNISDKLSDKKTVKKLEKSEERASKSAAKPDIMAKTARLASKLGAKSKDAEKSTVKDDSKKKASKA